MKYEDFQLIVFLNQCIYHDLAYPDFVPISHKTKRLSGLSAEIFEGKEFDIVVFCGSNDLKDWINNFLMIFGRKPETFHQALEFVIGNYSFEKPLYLTGHSLGGAIATYVCVTLNKKKVRALTFNGCGIEHLINSNATTGQCPTAYHYITNNDILNRVTRFLPFKWFKQVGVIKVVEDLTFKNGVKSHGNFNAFMALKEEELLKENH